MHVVNLWTHFNRETFLGVGNVEDSVPGGNLILFKATVIPFHVPLCTSPKLPRQQFCQSATLQWLLTTLHGSKTIPPVIANRIKINAVTYHHCGFCLLD